MEENKKQLNNPEEFEIDITVLLRDLLHSFSKLWWLTALLAAVAAVGMLLMGVWSYHPMYKAEATFTVETRNTSQSG